jgi:hypothetical protein
MHEHHLSRFAVNDPAQPFDPMREHRRAVVDARRASRRTRLRRIVRR